MASNHSSGAAPQVEKYENVHHIVPGPVLVKVLVALLILTFLTVFTAKFVHLGHAAIPVAFGIALVKALLVMAYFMGLKYDSKLNRVIFATGFLGLALLFFFSALDTFSRILQSSTLY